MVIPTPIARYAYMGQSRCQNIVKLYMKSNSVKLIITHQGIKVSNTQHIAELHLRSVDFVVSSSEQITTFFMLEQFNLLWSEGCCL